MGLIIDTCVFIEVERRQRKMATDKWDSHGYIFISAITASELLAGVHHANSKARHMKRSAFVEAILAQIPVLPFSLETARIHAELYAYLAKKGKLIGAHDLIIAATALAHGYAVLTNNHNEFKRVPGLTVLTD